MVFVYFRINHNIWFKVRESFILDLNKISKNLVGYECKTKRFHVHHELLSTDYQKEVALARLRWHIGTCVARVIRISFLPITDLWEPIFLQYSINGIYFTLFFRFPLVSPSTIFSCTQKHFKTHYFLESLHKLQRLLLKKVVTP